ncbi:ATP-dependent endonuclease [Streptomyces sp. NPDC057909]|uniref:ATP-dependent nuclease n=1 Tax=Streptomyces sp. NPDC057909 TaxID=3346277 RepID=UPI0036EBBEC5
MQVVVQPDRHFPSGHGPRAAILVPDSWNDRGYHTTYDLWFRPDDDAMPVEIGRVKIAHADQEPGPSPLPAGTFESLARVGDGRWFSLGQDDMYYENVRKLDSSASTVYGLLNDLAFTSNPQHVPEWAGERLDTARFHPVTKDSLLRSIEEQTVRGQFHRIAMGGPRLTTYQFDFTPAPGTEPLKFRVRPHSNPPSNIHVLVGRNGVGKTRLLRGLAQAVVHPNQPGTAGSVAIVPSDIAADNHGFVNVVSVTFSAFDRLTNSADAPAQTAAGHVHIGLNKGGRTPNTEAEGDLAQEFVDSLREVLASLKADLWFQCLDMLGRDPHIADLPIRHLAAELLDLDHEDEKQEREQDLLQAFDELSSGHAIVLLTITKLVEHVAERSLVLIDEPESHLHPPLLASFIQTLSHLLTNRNGVALIATHSPVVLQEVPRSCVLKLSRNGDHSRARRPRIETYGENVGVLTHEIFGLEVMQSGFYSEIEKAVEEFDTYDEVLDHFGRQLGDEAKGLVRILLADKEHEDD